VLAQGFVRVVTAGALIARHAGRLLADADRGSELAVDALVVATTIRREASNLQPVSRPDPKFDEGLSS
jgi:hypothetical protein